MIALPVAAKRITSQVPAVADPPARRVVGERADPRVEKAAEYALARMGWARDEGTIATLGYVVDLYRELGYIDCRWASTAERKDLRARFLAEHPELHYKPKATRIAGVGLGGRTGRLTA